MLRQQRRAQAARHPVEQIPGAEGERRERGREEGERKGEGRWNKYQVCLQRCRDEEEGGFCFFRALFCFRRAFSVFAGSYYCLPALAWMALCDVDVVYNRYVQP